MMPPIESPQETKRPCVNDSELPPAKQVIAASIGTALTMYGGHEIIVDLRHLEAEFLAAVNDTQIGVIRNRLADNRLKFVSNLPLAAKVFVQDQISMETGSNIFAQMRNLDVACHRLFLHNPGAVDLYSGRKRWNSGVFAILPHFLTVVEAERINFGPAGFAFEYWAEIKTIAEKLGPLPI